MQTIVIKLNPAKLEHADLDLRFRVTKRLEEVTRGLIRYNGSDFLENQTMGIWLETVSAREYYPEVLTLLQNEQFYGNDLSQAAEVYISETESADIENCTRVFPIND